MPPEPLPLVRPTEARRTGGPPGAPPARRLGEILIARGRLDAPRLEQALALQRRASLRLGDLLVAEEMVTAEGVADALAEQWAIARVDLALAPPDPALGEPCDPARCLALLCIPWRKVGGTIVVACADPTRGPEIAAACGIEPGAMALSLGETAQIRASLAAAFRPTLRARALTRPPEALSCRVWGQRSGRLALWVLAAIAAALLLIGPTLCLAAAVTAAILANTATMALRLAALIESFRTPKVPPRPDLPRLSAYRRLPLVSILVPLYRETAVLDPLLTALARIDYPVELLDIVLVLEEDDAPMVGAVAARRLPRHIRSLEVPMDRVRTKPRAMNYALDFCAGEIVGVYDAEDQPDPDQVALVVERFAESPPQMACVQARLSYFNAHENWLTRCFAIEYATWFEILLKGVQRLRFPLPLGGTSVFFRRGALEAVGAWDAHNVTEDADLGMRLARYGFHTTVIASTTWEEANCIPRGWVRQRARWLKGYIMTWITHMRDPVGLWRDLGTRGFVGFQVILLGGISAYLALPLLWAGWITTAVFGLPAWLAVLPAPLLVGFTVSLVGGQALMLAIAWRALERTGQPSLAPWLLTLPLYWPLGALAAYRAVIDVALAPFHWDKTQHGLTRQPPRADPARPPATLADRAG